MKKIISLILCVMLVVGAFAVLPASVSAYTLTGKMRFGVYVSSPGNGGVVNNVTYWFDDTRFKAEYGTYSADYTYQWLNDKNEVIADNHSLEGLTKEQLIGKRFKLKVSVKSCYITELTPRKYYADLENSQVFYRTAYTDYLGKDKEYQANEFGYNKNTKTYDMVFNFDSVYYPVNKVDINLPAPVDGEYPETYDFNLPEGTELNKPVVWEDKNDHVSLLANSLFKKGHTYSCDVYLQLKGYYYFAGLPTGSINGENATVTWYEDNKCRVTYKFPPAPAKSYNLWLGDTQVTDDNRGNILGDGKAKFDPATNTLTLNKAVISGTHTGADGYTGSIYTDGMDLTVKGSGTIGNDNVGRGICQYNSDLTTNCSLTLDGNFTFKGEYGVFTAGSLTVDGGSVISTGTVMSFGDCKVNAGVSRLEASGDNGTFGSFGGKLILDPSLKIIVPENGQVKEWGIVDANGQFVTHVVIRGESETYIRGDVDKSGKVNVFDASYILKGTTGTKDYPDYKTMDKDSVEFKRADVDASGTVNIFDAAIVLKHATGDKSVEKYGVGREVSE